MRVTPMLRPFAFFCLIVTSTMAVHATDFTLRVDAGPRHTIAARHIYDGFGCTGQNVAPAWHWQGVPANARSLAVTVYDPDAPTGSGWWHWMVLNLPATARGLPEGGALPAGAREVRNDFGTKHWGGPCPPAGDKPHHYVFTVYALDVPHIDVPDTASAALAGFALHAHVIGKAQQTLLYGR